MGVRKEERVKASLGVEPGALEPGGLEPGAEPGGLEHGSDTGRWVNQKRKKNMKWREQ